MRVGLISVIMPVYNAEKFIKVAIQSILSQSYKNFELLISDDASQDASYSIISSFKDSRIRFFRNTSNQGYLQTCNRLFKEARGEYIAFQDADDWSHSERLQAQQRFLNDNPNYGMVGCQVVVVDPSGNIIRQHKKILSHNEIFQNYIYHNQFGGATVMLRTGIIRKLGGYRHFFDRIGNEDYDLFARVIEQYKGANLDLPFYFYRQVDSSISKTVSPKNLLSNEMVKLFIKQRRENGKDLLETNNELEANRILEELSIPYIKNPSLLYIKYVEKFVYLKMFKKAIKVSFLNFRQQPINLVNIKLCLYCIKEGLKHFFYSYK